MAERDFRKIGRFPALNEVELGARRFFGASGRIRLCRFVRAENTVPAGTAGLVERLSAVDSRVVLVQGGCRGNLQSKAEGLAMELIH
jgi:hypothetical protein